MKLNFWVYALSYKWATAEMVKEAIAYDDCSIEDIRKGVETGYITKEEFQELTSEL
ncbi:XkdX family protein [Bacillus haynesii]|uniref:Phage portal protein n=2 Tax=Bacillus haynesii TaxID=1925021 RepID=A0AA90ETJ3_9BACI|nr:XkdX family protein [Bacillus haynesii]MCY7754124.1 XkdX family protein [Bacillus haynesii]MCY7791258.1 XkdX family protein [Bacillus haynesii]MCY7849820.1 XkdX family protein [Bacillus haynesii]MCY7912227.1 XkdX family protein [Bacillus haynesii]MCY7924880.1 XkdX family protein [Bacillus haynesii]